MGPPATEPIGVQLARTAKVARRAFDQALDGVGASLPTWSILVSVKGQHHGAQRALAEAVGIEGATLTHHLNRMEKAGLVTRRRDPDNRRVHLVELTAAGEEMFDRCLATVVAFDARLRGDLTTAELAGFSSVLGRIRTHVTEPTEAVLS